MTAEQMRMAAKILGGESIENDLPAVDDEFERLYVSDSEEDTSFTEIEKDRQNRLQKARDLVYNDSDDEDERQSISKSNNANNPINSFDMLKNGSDQTNDDNEIEPAPAVVFDSEEFTSQVIRQRLAELDDSDDESNNQTGNKIIYLNLL